MLRTVAGYTSYRLSTGQSDNPQVPLGSNLKFALSSLPKSIGNLAMYLGGFFVTIRATLTNGASGTQVLTDGQLARFVFQSLQLGGAWHGTPISSNNWLGAYLPTIMAVGSGYRRFVPRMPNIPSTVSTAFTFSKTFFIPVGLGNGIRPHHTAQLNVLYRQAYLQLNFQTQAFLTAFSSTTWSNMSCQVSALCFPEPEIRVGPGVEWIDYQSVAPAGQSAQIRLDSFGRKTQMENSEDGAAVAFAMWLDNQGGQGGSNRVPNITGLSIPFRSQERIAQIEPVAMQQLIAMGAERAVGYANAGTAFATLPSDTNDWPFHDETFAATGMTGAQPTGSTVTSTETNLLRGLAIVPQPLDVQTSKMQVVSGDTDYYLDIDGVAGNFTGSHHTLVQHLRSWTPAGWDNALKIITDSKLIEDVFGRSTSAPLGWQPKMSDGKVAEDVMPHKLRFVAMALKPKEHIIRKSAAKGHNPILVK